MERLEYLFNTVQSLDRYEGSELKKIDYWLYSKLNRKIKNATEHMEKLELRDAITTIFYDSIKELKRYFERGGKNAVVLREYLQDVVLMLQPIAPHMAEEMWHMLGNNTFAALERWPGYDESMINEDIELLEQAIDSLIDDARNAKMLVERKGIRASKMKLIIASEQKRAVHNMLVDIKDPNKVISESSNKELATKYVAKVVKQLNTLQRINVKEEDEFEAFNEASEYIKNKIGLDVEVVKEERSNSARAEKAMPLKPSIDLS